MIHGACHSVTAALYNRNTGALVSMYFAFLDPGIIYWNNLLTVKEFIIGILASDKRTFYEEVCFRNCTEQFLQCVYVFALMYNVFKQICLTLLQEG